MDSQVQRIFEVYRHFFPDLKFSEAQVYYCLLEATKKTSDKIISETALSRATVFSALKYLMEKGLVGKSEIFPVEYFAVEPKKAFSSNFTKLVSKLKAFEKSSFVESKTKKQYLELLLIDFDGKKALLDKHSKKEISNMKYLSEIRTALDCAFRKAKEKINANS